MQIDVEDEFIVGEDCFYDSVSPSCSYGVTFEDNEETGYFYAVDTVPDLAVLDALHIYDAASIADKAKPSKIQIVWSEDGFTAFLVINNYCHAIFDFKNKAGYCRNAFPNNNSGWANEKQRQLTDEMVEEYFARR